MNFFGLSKPVRPEDGPLAILAGTGPMPEYLAEKLHRAKYGLVILGVNRKDDVLKKYAAAYRNFSIEEAKSGLEFVKQQRVKRILLAGKVEKNDIYKNNFRPDELTEKTLGNAGKLKGDDNILKAVALVLKINGIQAIGLNELFPEDVVGKDALTRIQPDQAQREDIAFGLQVARTLGRLDIGQTVVVKRGTVLSVEAIEGTTEAIRRVAISGIRGAVVVKASKPQQDLKFDMPIIGEETLAAAKEAGCAGIATEAGRAFIVNKVQIKQKADQNGIFITGV